MSADELRSLAASVMALDGPCRESDAAISVALRFGGNMPDWAVNWASEWRATIQGSVVLVHDDGRIGPHFSSQHFTASLDAALSLVPDGGFWRVGNDGEGGNPTDYKADVLVPGMFTSPRGTAVAETGPLALAAAALLARAADMDAAP